jgi:hypothetical protein
MASDSLFANKGDAESALAGLTMAEIMQVTGPTTFSRQAKRRRGDMMDEIVKFTFAEQVRLRDAASNKRQAAEQQRLAEEPARKRRRLEILQQMHVSDNTAPQFMGSPTEEVMKESLAGFIERTNNKSLAELICFVCARKLSADAGEEVSINRLPSKDELKPRTSHPAHQLTDGMLLHCQAMTTKQGVPGGWACSDCMRDLRNGKIPSYSLANAMWIGAIPHELAVLTLPERILIARYFPASYIVKLYPKKKGAKNWDYESLNSGIKGNVATYRLNTDEIASMIEGDLMPVPAKVVAATIGVTIVGPRNFPERSMPSFLRVRRARVKAALLWLKANNPYYLNITISEERLQMLPVDGIPHEILAVTMYSDDASSLNAEHDGYVPSDDETDGISESDAGFSRPAGGICAIFT